MPLPTLLDLAKANGSDKVVGLIDEAYRHVPEIALIAARPIKGINFKTYVRTSNPTVRFRKYNDGVDVSLGTYEERLVECFPLDIPIQCDKGIADNYEDGPEAWMAIHASAVVNAAMQWCAAQMWYGADTAAFPAIATSSAMTADAGGTTASTGSSVWGLQFGPQGVQWVVGNGGSFDLSDLEVIQVPGNNGKGMRVYSQWLSIQIGLQVGNLNGVGRMKDFTADSGKTASDAKLAELIGLFLAGYKPDVLFMTRRSRQQIQALRTATTATGAAVPLPTDYDGIPIAITESLVNTETLS